MKRFLSMLALGCLGACVSYEHYTDPVAAQNGIKCKYDSFSNNVTCLMPEIGTCGDGSSATKVSCAFPSSHMQFKTVFNTDKTVAVFGLNGYVRSRAWTNPYRITDAEGNTIDFTSVDSDVQSCTKYGCVLYEYISVHLSREYISSHVNSGISMKIYGKRGDTLMIVPAAYVTGFDNFLKGEGL